MSKPTKKQLEVSQALLNKAKSYLDELGLDYAIVIHKPSFILSNLDEELAQTILRRYLERVDCLHDRRIEAEAERIIDLGIGDDKV